MHISCTIELSAETKQLISQETEALRSEYAAFQWDRPSQYRLELFSLPNIEEDLIPQLIEKIKEMTVDTKPMVLFGFAYQVKITRQIDIQLTCQFLRPYETLVESLYTFFRQRTYTSKDPSIHLAKYRIPSKQQYTHLKNILEKTTTAVEIPINTLTISKMTYFGRGNSEGVVLAEIPLQA